MSYQQEATRVNIQLKGFDSADIDKVESVLREEFPHAEFARTHFFSEQPPSYVEIVVNLIDVAKAFALPAGIALGLAKLIEKGKAIKEGLEGWQGLYQLLYPGERRRIRQIEARLRELQPGFVSIRVVGRMRMSSGHWPTVHIANAGPDDQKALLACLAPSLEKAIGALDAEGVSIGGGDFHVEVAASGFSLHWRNSQPPGEGVAVFDFYGNSTSPMVIH